MRDGRRAPLAAAAAAAALVVAVGVVAARGGSSAQAPPPVPAAEARSLLGSPRVGDGIAMDVRVSQSVVPLSLLPGSALPTGTIPGRLWIRSAREWRLELRGEGHDWQVTRAGDTLQAYSSASQTAYTLPRSALPEGLGGVGPTSVPAPVPDTLSGRAVHRVTYRPRGEDLLLDRVEIAADAETGVPLSVRAWATGRGEPVLTLTATDVRRETVDPARVTVRPPSGGATVPLGTLLALGQATDRLEVRGEGWGRVLVLPGGADVPGGTGALETPLVSAVPVRDGTAVAVGLLPPARVTAVAGD